MLYIEKKPCPVDIQSQIDTVTNTEEWKAIPEEPSSTQVNTIRDNYFDKLRKSLVREALITEQHGLCAYCMARIENSGDSASIDHFVPLSKSKSKSMDYENWLAVCKGGQNIELKDGEKRLLCCDAKKGKQEPTLNPLDQTQMDRIAYYDDGTIFYNGSTEQEQDQFNFEINKIFGLNGKIDQQTHRSRRDTSTGIVKHRRDAYIAMRDLLLELENRGELTSEIMDNLQQSYLSDEIWEPFVGVKLYVLKMFPNV